MADSQATTVSTLRSDGNRTPMPVASSEVGVDDNPPRLELLEAYPKILVLPTHLSEEELHQAGELIVAAGADLVHNAAEARLVLTALSSARRVRYELQARGLVISAIHEESSAVPVEPQASNDLPPRKRRRTSDQYDAEDDLSQLSLDGKEHTPESKLEPESTKPEIADSTSSGNNVKILQLRWLQDSIQRGYCSPIADYLVCEVIVTNPLSSTSEPVPKVVPILTTSSSLTQQQGHQRRFETRHSRHGRRDRNAAAAAKDLAGRSFMPSVDPAAGSKRRLLHETTTEHDAASDLPDMPAWVIQNRRYACERAALLHPPNEAFVDLLKKIKLARTLVGDEIGVRAYSTSIASIISYPYVLSSTHEILLLPGCDQKVAHLLQEYLDTGHVKAADDVDRDPVLSVLNSFYSIWGIGATTARELYYDRGWRDHDDIIEYGWSGLTRHQQIGLKYFDEFEQKMSRSEVELVASVVKYHAEQIVNDDIQCIIVGGYRRGKKESGDVDLIISHPQEEATKYLISPLVRALEATRWITHTLVMSEINSTRNQETLPLRSLESRKTGFDTLDKALVVWQDPNWPTRQTDLAANPKAKNPNVHRRVDIIVSPWKTVGCAVAGWTSGTTFQRDLRRYSRRVKGWKYDSSGVRDLGTGKWIDLEKWTDEGTRATSWQQAERRVFDGLELEWREPAMRNTG